MSIPTAFDVRHDARNGGNQCPYDPHKDSHIHISPNYGDETFDLEVYGPGIDWISEEESRDEWAWETVPALPSWWQRIRRRTFDAALARMSTLALRAADRHARAVATLTATGWRWSRVGGSTVAHLVPPVVLRRSRTACSRLPVFDMTLASPAGLLEDLPRCQGCRAYGKGGRA